jgi:UDP-glucose 4-epimerase
MTVLILGGAGFVGLNIAEALLAAGRDVRLFDRRPPLAAAQALFKRLPGRCEILTGDVRDRDSLNRAFAPAPRHVIYGAAITPSASREAGDPEAVLEVNLMALLRVIERAREHRVRRLVNLSSGGAYGDAAMRETLLDETGTATDPVTLYALTKFASERMCRRLAELWKLDLRSVRLSAVFGPWEHDSGLRDTLSPPYQVAQRARRDRLVLLPRPVERDWVYARDVAGAVHALLDAPAPRHDLYNISSGQRWTLLEWGARFAATIDGCACRVARDGETPNVDSFGAVDRGSLAIERLTGDLGYRPRFDLDRAFTDFSRWIADHPDAAPG